MFCCNYIALVSSLQCLGTVVIFYNKHRSAPFAPSSSSSHNADARPASNVSAALTSFAASPRKSFLEMFGYGVNGIKKPKSKPPPKERMWLPGWLGVLERADPEAAFLILSKMSSIAHFNFVISHDYLYDYVREHYKTFNSSNIEAQHALHAVFKEHRNVFLTGGAGTGKSFTVNIARTVAKQRGWNVFVVSSTAAAACLLDGATTVHNFLGMSAKRYTVENFDAIAAGEIKGMMPTNHGYLVACDLLILDEISMTGDFVMKVLQWESNNWAKGRGAFTKILKPNGTLPDGRPERMIVMAIGDFYQLSPVGAQMCFTDESWRQLHFVPVEMTVCVRQSEDPAYAALLGRMRKGSLTPDDHGLIRTRILPRNHHARDPETYMKHILDQDAKEAEKEAAREPLKENRSDGKNGDSNNTNNKKNSHDDTASQGTGASNAEPVVIPDSVPDAYVPFVKREEMLPTYILATNEAVCSRNLQFLNALPGPILRTHVATDVFSRKVRNLDGTDYMEPVPAAEVPAIRAAHATAITRIDRMIPPTLHIKEGCQYLITRNLSLADCIVNGTRCKFIGDQFMAPDSRNKAPKAPWRPLVAQNVNVEAMMERTQLVSDNIWLKRMQVPLKYGWAATVHSSQGATLDGAFVDFSKMFQPGMAYVAASRVKSLNGLYVLEYNRDSNGLRVSSKVTAFMESLQYRRGCPLSVTIPRTIKNNGQQNDTDPFQHLLDAKRAHYAEKSAQASAKRKEYRRKTREAKRVKRRKTQTQIAKTKKNPKSKKSSKESDSEAIDDKDSDDDSDSDV